MSEESRVQSVGKGVLIGATVVSMVVLTFLGVDMIKSQSTPKAVSMSVTNLKSSKSIDDLEKSDSVTLPLLLRNDITSYQTLFSAFITKYGFKIEDTKDKVEPTVSADQGWVYANAYKEADCTGEEYFAGGIATNKCMNLEYSNKAYSYYLECSSSGEVYLFEYSGYDCDSSNGYYSKTLGSTGCSALDSTLLAADDDNYNSATLNVQCSSSSTLPLQGEYDSFNVYLSDDDDAGASSCQNPILYEAYPIGACIPASYGRNSKISYSFTEWSEKPYIEYYSSSQDCTGKESTYSISTSCTSSKSTDIVYNWNYYESTSTEEEDTEEKTTKSKKSSSKKSSSKKSSSKKSSSKKSSKKV